MKNRTNCFCSKTYVSIFFLDEMGNERRIFDLHFPIYRKDKFNTAKVRLREYGYDASPTRIEWLNAWQGRKKGVKKMVVKFN